MNTNQLIAALTVAETNRMAAGRGGGNVWVEDKNGYRQIESVHDADGGVYIKLAEAAPIDMVMREAAWGLIANAGGDDWHRETSEWREAATRWRDRYISKLPVVDPGAQPPTLEQMESGK